MIKRFMPTETTYNHNKYILKPLRAEVVEEANGIFELEIELPKGTQLNKRDLITAPTPRGVQPFRVYRIVKTLYGIRAYARHIFYDLANALLIDTRPTNANGNSALQSIFTAVGWSGWTYLSDITEQKTAYYIRKNPVEAIIGAENSILNVWGGNLIRNKKEVRIMASGIDRGYEIRLGKNLIGIEDDSDDSNVVTRLYPTYEKDQVIYGIPEQYVDSPLIGNYPTPITKEIRVALTDDQKGYTDEQIHQVLRDYCNNLYAVDNVDKPVVNYKVDFVELSKIARLEQEVSYNYAGLEQLTYETIETLTYEQLESVTTVQQFIDLLEQIDIYDKVKIRVKELDIDLQARVIKYQYDALAERYIKIELGGFKNSNQYQINNIVQQMKNDREKASTEYRELYDMAINQVTGNKGGYQITRLNANNEPYETLWMDTPDIETAVNVLRINQNGIAGSANGFNGPYNVAITTDGWVVAERILANQLSAISADLGTITAGMIQDSTSNSYWDLDNGIINLNVNELKIQNQDVAGRLSTIEGKADAVQLEFDQLEIGAKNYIPDSEKQRNTTRFYELGISEYVEDLLNQDIVFSFEMKTNSAGILRPIQVYPYQDNGITIESTQSFTNTVKDKWERFYVKTKIVQMGTNPAYSDGGIGFYDYTGTNDYSLRKFQLEKGNQLTDWKPHPDELYAGITRIDKGGINVSVSTSEINSQLAYNGLEVRDGERLVAAFGETGAVIPRAEIGEVVSPDVMQKRGSISVSVGSGGTYSSVAQALNALFPDGKKVIVGSVTINVISSITEDIAIKNLMGGVFAIYFGAGVTLYGNIEVSDCTSEVRIIGNSASNTLIKGRNSKAAISVYGSTDVWVNYFNLEKDQGSNIAIFQQRSTVVVAYIDIGVGYYYAFLGYGGSITAYTTKGNTTLCVDARYGCKAFLYGTIPQGTFRKLDAGFVFTESTTPTDSTFSPPPVTNEQFTQIFTPTSIYTVNHDTSYVDSYYPNQAAQGRWSGMSYAKDGCFKFSADAYNFMQGVVSIDSVKMRVKRRSTSHGYSTGVTPKPYGFSGTFNAISLGQWSNWVTVPSSLFTSAGPVLKFYGPTLNTDYAIFDACEVEIKVTKAV